MLDANVNMQYINTLNTAMESIAKPYRGVSDENQRRSEAGKPKKDHPFGGGRDHGEGDERGDHADDRQGSGGCRRHHL
jgi:hypothetical protein